MLFKSLTAGTIAALMAGSVVYYGTPTSEAGGTIQFESTEAISETPEVMTVSQEYGDVADVTTAQHPHDEKRERWIDKYLNTENEDATKEIEVEVEVKVEPETEPKNIEVEIVKETEIDVETEDENIGKDVEVEVFEAEAEAEAEVDVDVDVDVEVGVEPPKDVTAQDTPKTLKERIAERRARAEERRKQAAQQFMQTEKMAEKAAVSTHDASSQASETIKIIDENGNEIVIVNSIVDEKPAEPNSKLSDEAFANIEDALDAAVGIDTPDDVGEIDVDALEENKVGQAEIAFYKLTDGELVQIDELPTIPVFPGVNAKTVDSRLSVVMEQSDLLTQPDLRDRAYLGVVEYALSVDDYNSAQNAVGKIAQAELRDTARSLIALEFARNGMSDAAFQTIDEVEVDELRDVMRLQVIESMIIPENLSEKSQ